MAEYVVAFVLDRLASHVIDEASSLYNVGVQIKWIERELRRMQSFLRDADSRARDGDDRVRNWVADVRDVAYDADDLIEDYVLRMAPRHRRPKVVPFKRCFYFLNEFILRHRFHKGMEIIKLRIKEIADSRSTYGIDNLEEGIRGEPSPISKLQEKRRFSVFNCEEDVLGLGEDIRAIESRLVQGGESRRSVISIFGMAGIGKTTLAKKVYLSTDVKRHFDCATWITVSQDYRVRDILFDLAKKLNGVTKADLESNSNEDLLELISDILEDKRYLIVLDDIWNCDVWDELKAAFPEKKNGSRIIITTRFRDAALRADPTVPIHEMCLLDEETSWELFSSKISQELNSYTGLPPWAEEIGRQILRKCGGLPLAIVVMAGLLSRKDTSFDEWLKVSQSMHWQLKQDPAQCSDILALSFNHLPYHLRPCFLYFGSFPEDFEIPVRRLINLWVAEGFVLQRGQEPLEDVAEDYLQEMISRSMVQVAKRKPNGKVKACCVHDLLRELCISKSQEDCFLEVVHGEPINGFLSKCRRLAVHYGALSPSQQSFNFRALLCFELETLRIQELKKFKLLRVLDLEGAYYLFEVDSAIGRLIHLRYLSFRRTWLKKLPSSVGNLCKLETLDLRSTLINPIPSSIWKLQSLRNLYLNELEQLPMETPAKVSLPNLQTLSGLCISRRSLIPCGLDQLINIRDLSLHGELQLQEKALVEWIFNLKNLECLKLHTSTTVSIEEFWYSSLAIPKLMFTRHHNRLSKLLLDGSISRLCEVDEFPPNLTELSLKHTLLMEDPMPKLEKLPNLRVLKLKQSSYVGKRINCSSGGFPQLQFLKLSFLVVETWVIEEGALLNLRQLELIECKKLKIVPNGLRPVTALRDLKLGYMPHDFDAKVQDRKGENWYRIHHILPL